MSRALSVALILTLVLAVQPAGATEKGSIEGVVLNGVTQEPVAEVLVTLTTGTAEDPPTAQTAVTDERGRYRFEDLQTGEDRYYALDAHHEGGVFSGGAISIPDDTDEEPVFETKLRVWDTTTDPSAIVVNRHSVFLVQNDQGSLSVIEAVTVTNISDDAYIGRAPIAERDETTDVPTLGFSLPAAAIGNEVSIVDSDLNVPRLLSTEYGFAATTAIPPGEHTVSFSYALEGTAASYDLSRRMLYPTLGFTIFAAAPLDISSNRLQQGEEAEVGGQTYNQYATDETLEAADSIQAVALADAGVPAGLLAGMAGALALMIALGAYPFLRRRRKDVPPDEPSAPPVDKRDELLKEIAALDVAHERGEITRDEWSARRAALKDQIIELSRTATASR
ncbi:MAG: hypothetical protein ACR2KQ_08015 [Actinomycetota bacterium]